ncbi:DDE family transposase [Edaphobacter modestus]|uniref:DDE family transposase n=1 Tax=Edaphobacter modestus TaxID=388466 RepID=A0A4Q7YWM2_9BACT|nr:DDE family transposase [Edaphobacter modestus]
MNWYGRVQAHGGQTWLRPAAAPMVVERSFAWAARFRRLVRDYERLSQTLAAFHYFAFACLMLSRIFKMLY